MCENERIRYSLVTIIDEACRIGVGVLLEIISAATHNMGTGLLGVGYPRRRHGLLTYGGLHKKSWTPTIFLTTTRLKVVWTM